MDRSLATLEELRAAFKRVNRHDPKALRLWFDTHQHLSTHDHAQVAGLSAWTIRQLKKRAGIRGNGPAVGPQVITVRCDPAEVPPANWKDDPDWLRRTLELYDVSKIARMVGRDRNVVKAALKRHNIPTKNRRDATKSKNPHCSHAWCWKHYVEQGLSQEKCAKLAGIAQQTFGDWLNRFNIPVRDAEQTERGRKLISFWEKTLIHKLRQSPTVRRVYVRDGYIHVRYKNYFWENYYTIPRANLKRPWTYYKIDPDVARLDKVPAVYPEFGTDITGTALYPAHITISRPDLKRASLLERRVAIHEFVRQLVTRGWMDLTYPDEVLREDLERMRTFDMADYLENGGLTAVPLTVRQPAGRKVMLNFFDFSAMWEYLRKPRIAVRLCNALLAKTVPFNITNMFQLLAMNDERIIPVSWGKRVPIPDATVYCALFRKLGITGSILDVNVGHGNRAVACAASGLSYTTADPAFQHALDRGFVETMGVDWRPYEGQRVDVALYDEGFCKPQMDKVLPYLDKAGKLIVFCPYQHKHEVLKYKPSAAVRIRTSLFNKTPHYLFVW